jgi:15-cis-phytoene synthase
MSGKTTELNAAYRHCRSVAKARAKNFYFAFLALPRAKRDAICAVYAFMRTADDIADAPGYSASERTATMQEWLSAWKNVEAGATTSDPVFLALRDSQHEFGISSQWLDQLVEGTTLDLSADNATYQTFEDLYRYCYLVASVVGLVCIRIFGYNDRRAEKLAEQTGVAFQLTNILRDVAEDASMGRVYLPELELREAGLSGERLMRGQPEDTAALKRVLASLAARAETFYESAEQLVPLIHADSRPALRVLVRIYHRLLRRIEASDFNVFAEKVKVPLHEKLAILALGLGSTLRQKVFAAGAR